MGTATYAKADSVNSTYDSTMYAPVIEEFHIDMRHKFIIARNSNELPIIIDVSFEYERYNNMYIPATPATMKVVIVASPSVSISMNAHGGVNRNVNRLPTISTKGAIMYAM